MKLPVWLTCPAGICFAAGTLLGAQDFGSLDGPPPRNHQFITYVAEQQNVSAGKRTVVELHFRVEAGYHVNSHTPKSELLIPTRLELDPAPGVKAAALEYPAGQEYSFAFDPKEKLDVYAGAFTVKVPLTVAAGTHDLHGTLKYQACDKAACYPPKSLGIVVPITATP